MLLFHSYHWHKYQAELYIPSPNRDQSGTLLSQVEGVMDGYRASDQWKDHPLTPWAFTMLNAMGDLFDIIPAVSKNKRPLFDKMTLEQLRQYSNKNGHCSALIRITPGTRRSSSDIPRGSPTPPCCAS